MNKIKVGHFEADDGLINLPIGFIPDVFDMDELTTANPDHVRWYRRQETDEASASRQGIITNGVDGVITRLSSGNGITAYDASAQRPSIGEYADATTPTARTSTAVGTYVKPSVGNAQDRGSIYECVASTGAVSTEPTWPSVDGQQVTDDASNTWEKVNVSLQRGGYQGVVIAAALCTNGQEWYYEAKQANWDVDHGDVDGWTSGIDPNA